MLTPVLVSPCLGIHGSSFSRTEQCSKIRDIARLADLISANPLISVAVMVKSKVLIWGRFTVTEAET